DVYKRQSQYNESSPQSNWIEASSESSKSDNGIFDNISGADIWDKNRNTSFKGHHVFDVIYEDNVGYNDDVSNTHTSIKSAIKSPPNESSNSSSKSPNSNVSFGVEQKYISTINYETFHNDYLDKSKFFVGLWSSRFDKDLHELLPIIGKYLDFFYSKVDQHMRGAQHIQYTFNQYNIYNITTFKDLFNKINEYWNSTKETTLLQAFIKHELKINMHVIDVLMSHPKDLDGNYNYGNDTDARFGFTIDEIRNYRKKNLSPSSLSSSSYNSTTTHSEEISEQIELRKKFIEEKKQNEEKAFNDMVNESQETNATFNTAQGSKRKSISSNDEMSFIDEQFQRNIDTAIERSLNDSQETYVTA
ncbi:hypothetical protein EB155_13960, partial [archaeon]|nr:hypothetical protein [archaeon]